MVANNMSEMLLALSNVQKQDVFYKWNLIEADKDDNKFVDCAIAGLADYFVTNSTLSGYAQARHIRREAGIQCHGW
jgi:predicted nucleic acid-binding protein